VDRQLIISGKRVENFLWKLWKIICELCGKLIFVENVEREWKKMGRKYAYDWRGGFARGLRYIYAWQEVSLCGARYFLP